MEPWIAIFLGPALGVTMVVMPLARCTVDVRFTVMEYLAAPRLIRLATAIALLLGLARLLINQILDAGEPWWAPALTTWVGYWVALGLMPALTLPSMRGRYGYTIPSHRFRYLPVLSMTTSRLTFHRVQRPDLAILLDPAQLQRRLGAHIPEDWPPEFIDEHVVAYLDQVFPEEGAEAADDGGDGAWWTYLLVTRDKPTLIGTCGYKGPPTEGSVEIGYTIVPSRQGQGYATEAARQLTRRALKDPRVEFVRAETLASRPASIRVLEKCGFTQVGKRTDPELDEPVLMFECTELAYQDAGG
ncbi:MAG: GNAT family N-acetyltransferase [Phycisphaerales bacterium]|nr:GNAT family N-acetyltransferase [Phycisphaerales bacterium]